MSNGPYCEDNDIAAYMGDRGANSELALKEYFGDDVETLRCDSFGDVVTVVLGGVARYGVLPLENSTTGGIRQVRALLDRYDMQVVGELEMKIVHHLLGLPGAQPDDITDVYSHEQALMQCGRYLEQKRLARHIYRNTASAAKYVAGLGDKTKAAIANDYAAELYGLKVLAPDISSGAGNRTRFGVIMAKPARRRSG